jgi:predicted neutral ceramidase superfamily lipid hydrolase
MCIIAKKARNFLAIICLSFFSILLFTVIFNAKIPFKLIPLIIFASFIGFVLSAMLASRFGRLCDAEVSLEYKSNITHMCSMQAKCMEYYNQVKNTNRVFTRLDLVELGAIYRQHSQKNR